MEPIISYFAVTSPEFWVGLAIVALALVLLIFAMRPEREYLGIERGVFPEGGKQYPTRRASRSEPPMRPTLPQMGPADAALVIREADGSSMTIITLLDLAARGYVELTEYRHIPSAPASVVVVFLKPADPTCTPEEAFLLEKLEKQGSAENESYIRSHPFDVPRFRGTLESLGLAPLGYPTARCAGIRRSISENISHLVTQRVASDWGWFRSGRQKLTNVGALELIGGALGAVVSIVLMLTGSLRPFWLIVCSVLVVLGAITMLGGTERTPDGSVARDQVLGFRRYLLEAPLGQDATLEEFSRYASWAVALDCVHEWEQSLERLSIAQPQRPDEIFPWIAFTNQEFEEFHQVLDIIKLMFARIHVNAGVEENGGDFNFGWQDA